jgi:hypothetical protein
MNPYEEKLAQFVEDEVMYLAVKGLLEAQFDLNVQIKDDMDNALITEIVRGCIDGRKRLREGFKNIDTHRKQPSDPHSTVNPGL